MCGICGIVSTSPGPPVQRDALVAMRDALAHRGPDDSGDYLSAGVALGSRRLAILDVSPRGHMPMATDDGRFHIVHNGEVYNFRELRAELQDRGRTFRSDTDTEVILQMYAEHGPSMLEDLNGMFAFAIWDTHARELFVGRDRLGVKPLYYAVDDDRVLFASEQKALFAAGVPCDFDESCWDELLMFRYVAGERTPFKGVRRLLPGHFLLWKDGELAIRRWWNLAHRAIAARSAASPTDIERWFEETFDDSIRKRCISDVPVGVLLSGGLDSGAVAASLASTGHEARDAFTVRFTDAGFDEGEPARAVAEQNGLTFHELYVGPDEMWALTRRAARLQDEPLAHANEPHLLAVSELAKPLVSVLLSGEGSDETLGGYMRYLPLRHAGATRATRPLFRSLAGVSHARTEKLARFAALDGVDEWVKFNACDVLPQDLRAIGREPNLQFDYRDRVLAEARCVYPRDRLRQAMYQDQHTFLCSLLDRNDRTTMGASIECREPFLDYRLVEGLAAVETNMLVGAWERKRLLRRTAARNLPPRVLNGRKWGFGVPWDQYFRSIPEVRAVIADLADAEPVKSGPFDRAQVRKRAAAFLAADSGRDPLIHQLFMITLWFQECVRN
jgi:asparagine synthase (glutamine-hydrolysing)